MKNYAIAIYFGDNTEYICWKNETSRLLENAIIYDSLKEAQSALKDAKDFADASGWVNTKLAIYEF